MPRYSAILATDGDQTLAVSNSDATLTLPAHYASSGVNDGRAVGLVRTAAILFTVNGTGPTAANEATGDKAGVGARVILEGLVEMRNFKAQRATSTDGAMYWRYEKRID